MVTGLTHSMAPDRPARVFASAHKVLILSAAQGYAYSSHGRRSVTCIKRILVLGENGVRYIRPVQGVVNQLLERVFKQGKEAAGKKRINFQLSLWTR